MRKIVYGLLLGAVGFATSPGPAAADVCGSITGNLIVNCGFETGNFNGWTQSGNTGFTSVQTAAAPLGFPGVPHSGNFYAALGPVGSDGFLSQTFNDTAGQTLRVEFFLGNDGGTPNDFHASFDANQLIMLTNDGLHGYIDYVFSVTATGHDTLTIGGFRNDPGFFNIDDVSVSPAVPEPATLTILGAAIAALGLVRRRRNT